MNQMHHIKSGSKATLVKMRPASRHRIGLVVPSSNTTMETELPEMLQRIDEPGDVIGLAACGVAGVVAHLERDDFEVAFDGDDLTVTTPEAIAYDQSWAYAKFSLVRTLRDHLGVGKVVFREVHEPRAITEEE